MAVAKPVNFRRQGRKVDACFDLDQRITQLVEGLHVIPVGKQVGLDGATLLHGVWINGGQMGVI